MARRKKRKRDTTGPPATTPVPVGSGNLPLMENIAKWCQGSIDTIMDLCDWHVQRETDGGVLGFKSRPGAKILAVAHLDYHCSGKVHELDAHHIVSSALDDRLGACLAYNLGTYLGIPADVVFCDKEETGRSTLPMFGTRMLDKYNWIVEFDRRGEGAVCYQYTVMEPYIKKHFELHIGSFSDICTICHVSPVGAFNMAVGYENEHSEKCHATTKAIVNQLRRFKAFYEEFQDVRILHTPPAKTTWQNRQSWQRGGTGSRYTGFGWEDDDDLTPQRTGYAQHDAGRNWVHDKKGNIVTIPTAGVTDSSVDMLSKLAQKALVSGKDDTSRRSSVFDDADENAPMGLDDVSGTDWAWLSEMDWEYDPEEDVFYQDIMGGGRKILTLAMFLQLDDQEQEKAMAGDLKQQYEDNELTAEDMKNYASIGWVRDPNTGEWYHIRDDDTESEKGGDVDGEDEGHVGYGFH